MNLKTNIYSIFPACGKTWLFEHQDDYGLKILDSDSSEFSWLKDNGNKIRNPDFPSNYIKHIKENIGKYDYIFVSSHASVRDALEQENIDFTIVYPAQHCKAEWVGRCFLREINGEDGCSAKVIYENWDQWISECFVTGISHKEIVLDNGEYLSDHFKIFL